MPTDSPEAPAAAPSGADAGRPIDAMAAIAQAAQAAGGAATGASADPIVDPADRQRAAPVHLWTPADCGPIDMRVRSDGLWLYQGTPIGRAALVSLFASVLTRADDGRHYLVTPAEKVEITVEDAAFVVVDVDEAEAGEPDRKADAAQAPPLELITNVGDRLRLGATRRLRVRTDPETGEPTPYAPVRGRLEARIDRKTFYRLVDRAVFVDLGADGRPIARSDARGSAARMRGFGFWSGANFFALATGAAAEAIENAAAGSLDGAARP